MTRALIGDDSTGVSCVKITKGNADPRTTPDSARNLFYYNSKWSKIIVQPDLEYFPYVSNSNPTDSVVTYFPAGSGPSNFSLMREDQRSSLRSSWYSIRGKVRYSSVSYDLPMFDLMPILSNGWYGGRNINRVALGATGGTGGVRGGYYGTVDMGSYYRRYTTFNSSGEFSVDYGMRFVTASSADSGFNRQLIIYNLPGNNVAVDTGGSASPGDKLSVLINSTFCRAAKPGFDVTTATRAQLAFDSTGRPLNVIAADDIVIPSGSSSYDTGVSLPSQVAIDMTCYTGAICYPMRPSATEVEYGVLYRASGSSILFSNSGGACRARFIVYGNDPTGPSSGTNRVLRTFVEGGENVLQLLRPGSANPPRNSDIILDTRRPVVQILADGYLSVPAHSGSLSVPTAQSISYDAAGFFPYVKYMTVHGSGLSQEVRAPRVNWRFNNSVSQGGLSGDSSYCQYNNTTATFYTARGTPIYTAIFGGSPTNEMDSNPIVGIRYYVLGIPA